jgi:hypothetical protein
VVGPAARAFEAGECIMELADVIERVAVRQVTR